MALRSAFFPYKEMMGELDNPTHMVLVIKPHLWYLVATGMSAVPRHLAHGQPEYL